MLRDNQLKMAKRIKALDAECLPQCLLEHLWCTDACRVAQVGWDLLDPDEITNCKVSGTRLHHLQVVNRDSGAKPEPKEILKKYCMSYKICRCCLRLEKTSAQQGDLLGYGRGAGVGRGLGSGISLGVGVGLGVAVAVAVAVGVGVAVGVTVAVAVAVGVGVGVTLGVGVAPPVTSRNAALIGPHVWKPWKSLTPRPRTKITWRPIDKLAVFMVASTATVGELNVPFIAMAVPPDQGGVSM
jgi:hypothetical protein